MRIPILNRIDRNYLIRRSLLLMRRLNKLLQNPLQLMLRIIRKPRIKQKIPRDRQQPHHDYTIIDQQLRPIVHLVVPLLMYRSFFFQQLPMRRRRRIPERTIFYFGYQDYQIASTIYCWVTKGFQRIRREISQMRLRVFQRAITGFAGLFPQLRLKIRSKRERGLLRVGSKRHYLQRLFIVAGLDPYFSPRDFNVIFVRPIVGAPLLLIFN